MPVQTETKRRVKEACSANHFETARFSLRFAQAAATWNDDGIEDGGSSEVSCGL